ncbi:glycosyltransferase family 4 protein [Patescibacteria group bacterium]
MVIGIDASRANIKERTGTEWYAFFLIKNFIHLIPSSYKVILYTKEPLREEFGTLPSNFVNKALGWPPRFLWTQVRLSFEMLVAKPDILFVPAHTIPIIHPRNTITTIHDVGFEREKKLYDSKNISYKSSFSQVVFRIIVRILTLGKYGNTELDYHRFSARFALKHAKKILTVSSFSKSEIKDVYNVKRDNVVVVPNGYDTDNFNQIRNYKEEKIIKELIGSGDTYILTIGRLGLKKNSINIVKAFGEYKKNNPESQTKLIMIGNKDYGYSKVEDAINHYGISQDIILPGWIDVTPYSHLLRGAEMFIFPSKYEGFGVPLLEAMACGIPIITSNAASMPEVCGEAAHYVNPDDVRDISKGIMIISSNNGYRSSLINKGLKRVKEYSWKITAAKTLTHIIGK